MSYAIKGQRNLKRIVAARVKQLFDTNNFFDDTGYSCLGNCLHLEVFREEGIVKFDMLGNVIATADARGEVRVINHHIWTEDEVGLDTLIEVMGDVLGMSPKQDYIV